ncbi:hypothetical protein RB195_011686 [Necator americanus]|uniref:tRNA (guanine-N(7)-)-methyltransferase non-catalytic subunit n=1 Tax=Necator americanus TaxID=51031 RepID=A0ABR1D3K4_NECAM
MATVHTVDGRLIICASSKVFSIVDSQGVLDIRETFDVKNASTSAPKPNKCSEANSNVKQNNGSEDPSYQVLCCAVSNCGTMLAIGTSEKTAMILNSKSLQMRRAFRIPKAPTSVCFDKDDSHIIIGDRAGHVICYTVEPSEKSGYVDMNGEECPYEGEPLTSAISMVLDVAISHDGRFLLAADRDEKIRVSRYPQAFVVQSFCLGHSAYVSSVAVHGHRVFSTGGDSIVHEWNIETGKSVAKSDKLDEVPVRRICLLPKDEKFNIVAISGNKLHILNEKLQEIRSVDASSAIMDVSVLEENVYCVSSSGVFSFNVAEGTLKSLTVTNDLIEALSNAKDPISNYFKNVTHQNMVDYYKRKAEKIESIKEKQNRKRKAKEERRKAEKRLAGEAEVTC